MKGLTSKELSDWVPPRQSYIISDGILVPQTKMIIFGRYQTWKSILTIHTACCIATGKPWFSHRTSKSSVYIVQTEVPQAQLRDRVIKYTTGNKVETDQIWFATEPYIKLDKGFGISDLEKELSRTQARVLIVDPVYKVVSGHLVDEYDVRQFMDRMDLLIDKFKVTIIIVHHPRKAMTFDGQEVTMGGDDMFGSYLQNWCDTCIRTQATKIDTEITITFEKVRHAVDEIKPLSVKVDRDTLGFSIRR